MRTARYSALSKLASPVFLASLAGTMVLLASNVGQAQPTSKPQADTAPPEGMGAASGTSETNSAPATAPDSNNPVEATPEATSESDEPVPPAAEGEGAEPSAETETTAPSEPTELDPQSTEAGGARRGTEQEANFGFGSYPNPALDEKDLKEQGKDRPTDLEPNRVFAEEWWAHTRPTLEFHGNFRVRTNLYHNFHLGRIDTPQSALWPRPLDDSYTDLNGNPHETKLCTPDEVKSGSSDNPADADQPCRSPTQAGADLRFRIEPAVIISDNLRVRTQIDLLSNLVMGSTTQGNVNFPASSGGYYVSQRSGYVPISGMSSSQDSPVSGVNSLQDAVSVRRAWAEYDTPVGQLKFGRMPDQWGLGMLYNAGDGVDGDYQSTADRIAFTTGLPSISTYIGGSWDFQDEGATSSGFTDPGGPAHDLSQRDDVSRINLQLYRRMDAQLERNALAKGKIVVNGGLYLSYRWQRLANDYSGPDATCDSGADALGCGAGEGNIGYVRRGMKVWTPDVYFEVKYDKFSSAIEVVTQQGKFDSLATVPNDSDYVNKFGSKDGWKVRQWGFAGEFKQKLVEDRLLIAFYYGYATGDSDVDSLVPSSGGDPVAEQHGDRTLSTFRFHPGYRVDLILNRNLLSRVQGSYYFKPSAQYDFIRKASGLKVGGRADAIWTRASNFMQTPGHQRDLGIELDGSVYYQSKDGSLNSRDDLTGGFFAMAQYGVLFPLGGLSYLQDQEDQYAGQIPKLKPAQMVRMFLGVVF